MMVQGFGYGNTNNGMYNIFVLFPIPRHNLGVQLCNAMARHAPVYWVLHFTCFYGEAFERGFALHSNRNWSTSAVFSIYMSACGNQYWIDSIISFRCMPLIEGGG